METYFRVIISYSPFPTVKLKSFHLQRKGSAHLYRYKDRKWSGDDLSFLTLSINNIHAGLSETFYFHIICGKILTGKSCFMKYSFFVLLNSGWLLLRYKCLILPFPFFHPEKKKYWQEDEIIMNCEALWLSWFCQSRKQFLFPMQPIYDAKIPC